MKKIITLFLTVLVVLSASAIPVLATSDSYEQGSYESTLTLCLDESGIYRVSNPNARSGVMVYADDGAEIYTDSNNGTYMRIDDTRFFKAEKVELQTYDSTSFYAIADEYGFSSQLIDDVTALMTRVNAGEVELLEPVTIYVPERNTSNLNARLTITDVSSRTYTGYKNRQYYEEIVKISGISNDFNVRNLSSGWKQYVAKVISSFVETAVDGIMDGITGNAWTLAGCFAQSIPTSIPTNNAMRHTAKLVENKYIKYTSLYQGSTMYLGSVTEYAYKYRFQNILNFDGWGSLSSGYTDWFDAVGTGYSNADEYAYRYYLNTYNNPITRYWYKSDDGSVNVYVSSLY